MKTLKDHTILYDAVCPLCMLYTGAFVQTGMLDREGREPYQDLPRKGSLDWTAGGPGYEIALVDRKTGAVYYGIHSLFRILGHAFPVLQPLFRFRPFAWLMKKWYNLISYNRRVIMPSAASPAEQDPSFNRRYRLAYLVFAWIMTAFVLYRYSLLMEGLVPEGNFLRELAICGGQVVFQLLFLHLTRTNRKWDYLGSLMTISLGGALLLVPPLLVPVHLQNALVLSLYFMVVVTLMLAEHMRRSRILGVPFLLTLTWVVYRCILLFTLFKMNHVS